MSMNKNKTGNKKGKSWVLREHNSQIKNIVYGNYLVCLEHFTSAL